MHVTCFSRRHKNTVYQTPSYFLINNLFDPYSKNNLFYQLLQSQIGPKLEIVAQPNFEIAHLTHAEIQDLLKHLSMKGMHICIDLHSKIIKSMITLLLFLTQIMTSIIYQLPIIKVKTKLQGYKR